MAKSLTDTIRTALIEDVKGASEQELMQHLEYILFMRKSPSAQPKPAKAEASPTPEPAPTPAGKKRRRRKMSAAQRKAVSARMAKYWAERRKTKK